MSRRRRLDDDVPRLPRGRGMKFTTAQLVQIVMVAVALVAVIVLQKPCARSVSRFVTSFDQPDGGVPRRDAASAGTGTTGGPDGVILRGDMTPAEIEAAIAKARAQAGASTTPAPASALDAGVPADAFTPR